jgi:hypothetical protein
MRAVPLDRPRKGFGLRDVGIFYSLSRNPKNNCGLSGDFGARLSGKYCGLCPAHTNRDPKNQEDKFIFE